MRPGGLWVSVVSAACLSGRRYLPAVRLAWRTLGEQACAAAPGTGSAARAVNDLPRSSMYDWSELSWPMT